MGEPTAGGDDSTATQPRVVLKAPRRSRSPLRSPKPQATGEDVMQVGGASDTRALADAVLYGRAQWEEQAAHSVPGSHIADISAWVVKSPLAPDVLTAAANAPEEYAPIPSSQWAATPAPAPAPGNAAMAPRSPLRGQRVGQSQAQGGLGAVVRRPFMVQPDGTPGAGKPRPRRRRVRSRSLSPRSSRDPQNASASVSKSFAMASTSPHNHGDGDGNGAGGGDDDDKQQPPSWLEPTFNSRIHTVQCKQQLQLCV